MSRIKDFRFRWLDAWYFANHGYDAVLETSENGDISVLIRVNMEPYKISLTGREDEFIEDMNLLKNWDRKAYEYKRSPNTHVIDGTKWAVLLSYDDVSIYSRGGLGYPLDFLEFLDIFHEKYMIPMANFEENLRKEFSERKNKWECTDYDPGEPDYMLYMPIR